MMITDNLLFVAGSFKLLGISMIYMHYMSILSFGSLIIINKIYPIIQIYYFLLISMVFTLLIQIYYKGCIVTKYERLLTGWNFTVVDPILWLTMLNCNKQNRYLVTLMISIMGIILL